MAKTMDVVLTATLSSLSLAGMAVSAWSLSPLFTPMQLSEMRIPPSAVLYLIAFALVVEGVRFILAYHGKSLWRTSPLQCITVALPIWLLCTMFCVLIPFLALLLIPVPALPQSAVANLSLSWLCLQLAIGLMPGVLQPMAPRAEVAALAAVSKSRARQPKALPKTRNAAARKARPKQVAGKAAVASADDLFQMLAKFAHLPEGSKLSKRGHVAADGELVLSQEELASLIHRSKSTVRRWLQELEQRNRITKLASGKQPTRLRIQQHSPIQPLFEATPTVEERAAIA